MEKKSILSRIGNIYNNLEEYLLVVSLVINVLLVFLQVIIRTVFKTHLPGRKSCHGISSSGRFGWEQVLH